MHQGHTTSSRKVVQRYHIPPKSNSKQHALVTCAGVSRSKEVVGRKVTVALLTHFGQASEKQIEVRSLYPEFMFSPSERLQQSLNHMKPFNLTHMSQHKSRTQSQYQPGDIQALNNEWDLLSVGE